LGAEADPQSEASFARSRLDWSQREEGAGAQMLTLYGDLLALRREEPALRPGASDVHEQDAAEWLTVLRILPLQHDIYDHTRSRRALLCAFNLSGRAQDIPIRPEAIGHWRLRLSTDAVGYGGSGMLTEHIPATDEPDVNDAPKRLLETKPAAAPGRTITLPSWSAAIYVRDFPQDHAGVGA
jgi:1,4-alpha-glucan branching enzyme